MTNFQGSINQLLGLATVGLKLNPQVEKLGQKRELKGQLRVLDKQGMSMDEVMDYRGAQDVAEVLKEETDIKKKLFQLDPTEKRYKEFTGARRTSDMVTSMAESMRQKAQLRMSEEQSRVAESRRNNYATNY